VSERITASTKRLLAEFHKIPEEANDPRTHWTINDLEKFLYGKWKEMPGKFIVCLFNTGRGILWAEWRITPTFIKKMERKEP